MRVGAALPVELKEPGFEGTGGWSPGKLEDGAADANRRFCSLADPEDTNSMEAGNSFWGSASGCKGW